MPAEHRRPALKRCVHTTSNATVAFMQQIADWMERSNLNPTEVARRAGMPRSTLHRIVSGASDPKLSTIREIAIACGVDIDIATSPLSDPHAAEAARILLEDGYTVAESAQSREWVGRLTRLAGEDPIATVTEAAKASTLVHRAGAHYFTGELNLIRISSEASSVSCQWALSGAPMLQGRGPAIVWTDNPDALARHAALHLQRPATRTGLSLIIVPVYPGLLHDSFVKDSLRFVAPIQMLIDSLGVPGPLAVDALAEAKAW